MPAPHDVLKGEQFSPSTSEVSKQLHIDCDVNTGTRLIRTQVATRPELIYDIVEKKLQPTRTSRNLLSFKFNIYLNFMDRDLKKGKSEQEFHRKQLPPVI